MKKFAKKSQTHDEIYKKIILIKQNLSLNRKRHMF